MNEVGKKLIVVAYYGGKRGPERHVELDGFRRIIDEGDAERYLRDTCDRVIELAKQNPDSDERYEIIYRDRVAYDIVVDDGKIKVWDVATRYTVHPTYEIDTRKGE